MKFYNERPQTTYACSTHLQRKTIAISVTTTCAQTTTNPFNPNDDDCVACSTHSQEQYQLQHGHIIPTLNLHGRQFVRGNGDRQLRALLYELLAISTSTSVAISTRTIIATTTFAMMGGRLISFSEATELTATMPIAANAPAFTAVPKTKIGTLSAVSTRALTANAFMQMNSTSFWDYYRDGSEGNAMPFDSSSASLLGFSDITTAATTTAGTIASTGSSMNAYLVALPWPKSLAVAIFLLLILVTVVGNTLVILSVLTTRRLRTVTNCFVMNLAITDWLVGTCVMPPAVMLYIVGSWHFGWILCDIWISLDVLLCTGSILSLCAISLDRYLAVTQPLTYSKKHRSKRLALFMILIVWVMALLITCPPYLGWYEKGRRREGNVVCRYNQNKGYVVFSAMGSFFIPLAVMMYVYLKIGYVLTSRRQRIARDANSERTADNDIDCDNFITDSEQYQCVTPKLASFKSRWGSGSSKHYSAKNLSVHCSKCSKYFLNNTNRSATINGDLGTSVVGGGLKRESSVYELVGASHLKTISQCPTISCKYAGVCLHSAGMGVPLAERRSSSLPMQAVHFVQGTTSFSENCLAATATDMITGPNIRLSQALCQNQQHLHASHPHIRHQNSHRIPMRVSTTKRDTKPAKTLTIVMGGFIACWLPFFIYYLLMPFLPLAAVFEGLMSFLTWVGWVNCAINPFIYAFYNPDFRTAFWRLTCSHICKPKPPPNHLAMFRG